VNKKKPAVIFQTALSLRRTMSTHSIAV